MIFVDTNYFLRFLLADNVSQHRTAKQLFLDAAEGRIKLFTSTVTIFEIYWVLSSFYGKGKEKIAKTLEEVLNLNFVEIESKEILRVALETYRKTNLSLEDSFNLAFAASNEASGFKTFDVKLEKEFQKL